MWVWTVECNLHAAADSRWDPVAWKLFTAGLNTFAFIILGFGISTVFVYYSKMIKLGDAGINGSRQTTLVSINDDYSCFDRRTCVSISKLVCDTKPANKVMDYICISPEILQYYPLHSSLLLKFIYVRLINRFWWRKEVGLGYYPPRIFLLVMKMSLLNFVKAQASSTLILCSKKVTLIILRVILTHTV